MDVPNPGVVRPRSSANDSEETKPRVWVELWERGDVPVFCCRDGKKKAQLMGRLGLPGFYCYKEAMALPL